VPGETFLTSFAWGLPYPPVFPTICATLKKVNNVSPGTNTRSYPQSGNAVRGTYVCQTMYYLLVIGVLGLVAVHLLGAA